MDLKFVLVPLVLASLAQIGKDQYTDVRQLYRAAKHTTGVRAFLVDGELSGGRGVSCARA